MKRNIRLASLGAIVLLAASAAFAAQEGSFDRTLKVSGHIDLDVQSGSGNIVVRSGEANSVVVHGRIRVSESWFGGGGMSAEEKVKRIEQNPPIEQNGSSIRVGHISDEALRNNVSISYEITVPRDSAVETRTGSGDERISGVNGAVRAQSGSGGLEISDIGSDVRANAGSGNLTISNIKGRLYVQTGSGDIKATGIGGGLDAHAGSGDITFEQTAAGSVRVETGSGTIRLRNVNGSVEAGAGSGDIDVQGTISSDWRIHTGSGEVTVKVPGDARFSVNARSTSGDVRVNHPVTMQGSLRRNEIVGTVNGGGTALEIRTGSGSIHVD
jgi:hypothetical protein